MPQSQTLVRLRSTEVEGGFPQRLPLDLAQYPKLSSLQAGHLRHFYNLSAQVDGEWRHMGAQEPAQEWDDAYRFQLSAMAYATGVAHYHRLPALRPVFKSLMRRLIHKMLRREVWGYWFNTSMSGSLLDPSLVELRKPWADPVKEENIMYSGHLLLMTSLYGMLFDDDEFEKPDSLIFNWDPMFWGFGPEVFKYDNRGLQEIILKEMEKNQWMGVCCEPNSVFVACNQFPLIAVRYNDVRDGTNRIDAVLDKYKRAWTARNMLQPNGLYADWWRPKQDDMVSVDDIGLTAWANAFMNSWNSDFVYSVYDSQVLGYLTTVRGQTTLKPPNIARAIRNLVEKEGANPSSQETIDRAIADAAGKKSHFTPLPFPTLGYVVEWLSEVGRTQELESLLRYVDVHQKPSWENGGLYYPRLDELVDHEGNLVRMDPLTGNAGIGYARLNVKDGQKIMWEKPWTRETLRERPWVDSPGLESGVNFLRGTWDNDANALVVTMKPWNQKPVEMALGAYNLRRGLWAIYIDGDLKETRQVTEQSEKVEITVQVHGDKDTDVVFINM